jgi:hypothetical protein
VPPFLWLSVRMHAALGDLDERVLAQRFSCLLFLLLWGHHKDKQGRWRSCASASARLDFVRACA